MTEYRLPRVNQDDGTWGDILVQYLTQEHYNDDTDNAAENGGHQFVTIRPGVSSAGGAPLKFSSSSNLLSTREAGAMEFDTDTLYFTQTTGTTRKKIAMYDDASGATGDIYYRNSSGYFTRLGIGSTNDVLTVVGGLPSWQPATGGTSLPASDTTAIVKNDTDNSKQLKFDLSGLTTGHTTTLAVPEVNGTTEIVGKDIAQTLTNKTISGSSNTLSNIANASLTNSAITIAGTSTSLGGSITQDTITGLSSTGLIKRTGANALAIATSGTDYAPATSGSSILKGNGSGGFSNAASGTDYAPATSGTSILKGNGSGGFTSAVSGTDYAAATHAHTGAGSGGQLNITTASNATGTPSSSTYLRGDNTWATVSAGTSTPTASTTAQWDGNTNMSADTFIKGTTSTATAAGTTTMDINSTQVQIFTGSTTQNVNLPTTSIVAGQSYTIVNQSSGAVTVRSSGANNLLVLAANTTGIFTAVVNTPTTAAHWVGNALLADKTLTVNNDLTLAGTDGKTLTVNNSLTLSGTDSTVMTFPSTSATVARTDAAQTFTGVQTFSSAPSFGALPTGAGVASAATASTLAARDSSANLLADNFITGSTSTATAAGTTTMTIDSTQVQVFTGTSTQTVKLPTTSVTLGMTYTIINQSTGDVTVQSSDATTMNVLKQGNSAIYTAAAATPTTPAGWYSHPTNGQRYNSVASSATPAINSDHTDYFAITGLTTNITSMTTNLTGTPIVGQQLMISIFDSSSHTITWGASFTNTGVANLPTATQVGKRHWVGLVWDGSKWACLAADAIGY